MSSAVSGPLSSESPTILAVDDEVAVLDLCSAILQQAGFHILRATGSSEALKICKNHESPIHLLLTDLVLPAPEFQLATGTNEFPHVHGHDLAVRASAMRKDLRIIFMSGNPDHELAGYGIVRGNLPFLQKPFDRTSLTQLVREVLQGPPTVFDEAREAPQNSQKKDINWY